MRKLLVGLFATALLASCHTHGHDEAHAHDENGNHIESHGPELEALAYTIYSEKTELFVEFKPLVVGEESRFAAHFTTLGDSFKAVGEGSVTLSLKGTAGDQAITADAPEVPGIFRLRLTPEKAGEYKLIFDIRTPAYTDRIAIDPVTVYPDAKTALEDQSPEGGGANGITYLKEQAWKVDFANMSVKRAAFFGVVKTSGLVAAAPGAEQTVTARTPGIVSFVNNSLIAGTPISSGQALFTISSQGFTSDNAPMKLQEAKISLDKAKADYERLQRLLTDQLTTQGVFLQAKAEFEKAQAFYDNLSGTYGQSGQRITTPQSGYVKSLLVSPGQYVEAGQPLAVVSKNNRLTVKAEISPTVFAEAGRITSANFRVNNSKVYSLPELNGKLLSIGQSADPSMFIPIWFEVDNREGMIPGAYIEVFLQTNAVDHALVIPISAIMEEQGNYYCYVQTEGESFEKRELLLGGNNGRQVQVLSGVAEDERVVTKGTYNIKLSTASGTLPAHGHEH